MLENLRHIFEQQPGSKAFIKWCIIVNNSARAHFSPNYHQLSSTIMHAVKQEKAIINYHEKFEHVQSE